MKHCVTVWANGSKIRNWINCMHTGLLGYRPDVVHMDKIFPNRTIFLLKIKITDYAFNAIVLYTGFTSLTIAFMSIYIYLFGCTLNMLLCLIRKSKITTSQNALE